MLIEIDGYDQQVLLRGQSCTFKQLDKIYRQAKKQASPSTEIAQVMCECHQFTRIPYKAGVQVAFVIDTDTDRIYAPSY